jgi:hypothetical protein
MLMGPYRSSHEPRVPELIAAVLAFSRGDIAQLELRRLVHRRDTDYVTEAAQEECKPLMKRFFPELTDL